jgi:DNA (cytosine-5)-methyltransferase 1
MENVKGLTNTHKHRKFLHAEIAKLERHGYAVDLRVLSALDLGIPQDRERVFMIGVRRNYIKGVSGVTLRKGAREWFPWPSDTRYEEAKERFSWPATSPFGEDPSKPDGVPPELCAGPLIMNQEEIETLPNGTEGFEAYSKKFLRIPEGDDSRKSFKRLHRWRYSPTVAYGNNEVHLHPALPRRLRVREAMRLQTVPDTYALPQELPLSAKFKLIGNGVPVRLAERVASSLAAFLAGESPPREWRLEVVPKVHQRA